MNRIFLWFLYPLCFFICISLHVFFLTSFAFLFSSIWSFNSVRWQYETCILLASIHYHIQCRLDYTTPLPLSEMVSFQLQYPPPPPLLQHFFICIYLFWLLLSLRLFTTLNILLFICVIILAMQLTFFS